MKETMQIQGMNGIPSCEPDKAADEREHADGRERMTYHLLSQTGHGHPMA